MSRKSAQKLQISGTLFSRCPLVFATENGMKNMVLFCTNNLVLRLALFEAEMLQKSLQKSNQKKDGASPLKGPDHRPKNQVVLTQKLEKLRKPEERFSGVNCGIFQLSENEKAQKYSILRLHRNTFVTYYVLQFSRSSGCSKVRFGGFILEKTHIFGCNERLYKM